MFLPPATARMSQTVNALVIFVGYCCLFAQGKLIFTWQIRFFYASQRPPRSRWAHLILSTLARSPIQEDFEANNVLGANQSGSACRTGTAALHWAASLQRV